MLRFDQRREIRRLADVNQPEWFPAVRLRTAQHNFVFIALDPMHLQAAAARRMKDCDRNKIKHRLRVNQPGRYAVLPCLLQRRTDALRVQGALAAEQVRQSRHAPAAFIPQEAVEEPQRSQHIRFGRLLVLALLTGYLASDQQRQRMRHVVIHQRGLVASVSVNLHSEHKQPGQQRPRSGLLVRAGTVQHCEIFPKPVVQKPPVGIVEHHRRAVFITQPLPGRILIRKCLLEGRRILERETFVRNQLVADTPPDSLVSFALMSLVYKDQVAAGKLCRLDPCSAVLLLRHKPRDFDDLDGVRIVGQLS